MKLNDIIEQAAIRLPQENPEETAEIDRKAAEVKAKRTPEETAFSVAMGAFIALVTALALIL